MKKKVIQMVAASMLVGSTFATTAPFTTKASSVSAAVSRAVKEAKEAQDTYAKASKVVSKKAVRKEFDEALKDYNTAKKLVAKDKSHNKAKYTNDLKKAHSYLVHAKEYIKALNYAKHVKALGDYVEFALFGRALWREDHAAATEMIRNNYTTLARELSKADSKVKKLVYGGNAEKFMIEKYFSNPKEVQPLARAYYLASKAENDIKAGNIESATSRLAEANKELMRNKGSEKTYVGESRRAATNRVVNVSEDLKAIQDPSVQNIIRVNATKLEVSFNEAIDQDTVNESITINNIPVNKVDFKKYFSKDGKTFNMDIPHLRVGGEYVVEINNEKMNTKVVFMIGKVKIAYSLLQDGDTFDASLHLDSASSSNVTWNKNTATLSLPLLESSGTHYVFVTL